MGLDEPSCKMPLPKDNYHYIHSSNFWDKDYPKPKCRECRNFDVECFAEHVDPKDDRPLNETTKAIWRRIKEKDILSGTRRRDFNLSRKHERLGLRLNSSSFNIIENPHKKILGPGVIEQDLREIAHLQDFKERKSKKSMLDLDLACLTIDSVVKRPQVLTEEKMDYDVYSKYPLRMPNRNKTIEVYKMLGHKFPTFDHVSVTHEALENTKLLAEDYKVRDIKKKMTDMSTYQISGIDREIGDCPEKGFGSKKLTPEMDRFKMRFQRTYNDHYRVPKPYNTDVPKFMLPDPQPYKKCVSKFTDLGSHRQTKKYHDQTGFYENRPQRRENDPIVNPIGDPIEHFKARENRRPIELKNTLEPLHRIDLKPGLFANTMY